MSINLKIKQTIEQILKVKFNFFCDDFINVEVPKNPENGDFSSNIAMKSCKKFNLKPLELASIIKEELEKVNFIDKVEIAGFGFINIFIKKSDLSSIINTILNKNEHFGENNVGNNQKILVEYVSANPTGRLHLGHARGAAWGDSVCRLLKKSGFDCLAEYYINDAGAQMQNLGKSINAKYAKHFNIEEEVPLDGYIGSDISEIALNLVNEYGDSLLNKEDKIEFFKNEGKKQELEIIKQDLEMFRVSFDSWISEQSLYDSLKVEHYLKQIKNLDLTYTQDNALWFKTTDYGDDKDRVLIKADGLYTYLTPDIANHMYKIDRGYEKLVDLWGADHHGYIPRMKAALKALTGKEDILDVDIIQMVRLVKDGQEVKMSKRTGNAITIKELCDEIGVDATRYFFVSKAVNSHLDFDISLACKKSNENPVYYAQYAHARICSILNKANEVNQCSTYDLLVNDKETELLKCLNVYVDTIKDCAINRAPNKLCNYIQKLATLIHSFYASVKVIDENNLNLTNQRLNLLKATKIVLKNALELIGVSAPEKM